MNKPRTILIIDDRPQGHKSTGETLSRAGFNVCFSSQVDGVKTMERCKPDLVILHLHSSESIDSKLIQQVKFGDHRGYIPLLQITENGEELMLDGYEEEIHALVDHILFYPFGPLALISTVHGLLRLKRAKDTLHETEESLKLALKSSQMAIWYWDVQGDRIQYSESFNELFGREETFMGWTYEEFLNQIHEHDRDRVEAEIDDVFQGRKNDFSSEFRVIWPDQSAHWLTGRGEISRDCYNHVIAVRGAFVNIQKLKRAEIESEEARKIAERACQAKTQFLANMSHEIRTPISAILGFADLLIDPRAEANRTELSRRIKSNGAQLLRLIDDILDISKFEVGVVPIEKDAFSVRELISDVMKSFLSIAREKGLQLEFQNSLANDIVYSDPMRLRQILSNLIGNAVKFSTQGFVRISMVEDKMFKIDVQDYGIGMSADDQSRIFQPFSQADSSIARRFGGSGLGLVLSRRLANALGGDLVLTWSEPGKGSLFQVSFDPGREEERVLESSAPIMASEMASRQELQNVRVLLVDDSLDNEELIRFYLSNDGAIVDVAHDGFEALEKASEGKHDVVLMDVQMPGMDGLEATRRLRRSGYSTPIIALTAHALREEVSRSLSAGCNAHLTKPITRKELMDQIRDVLH